MARVEAYPENYCRERAAEARAKAEAMQDYEARQTMLRVAQLWELMADRAAQDRRPPD